VKNIICDYIKPVAVGVLIVYITGFTVWLFDIQKLMVQMVEQGKAANAYMLRNEKRIDINDIKYSKLDSRVDDHEVRIKVIESK